MEDKTEAVEVDQLIALLPHSAQQTAADDARTIGEEEMQRQNRFAQFGEMNDGYVHRLTSI